LIHQYSGTDEVENAIQNIKKERARERGIIVYKVNHTGSASLQGDYLQGVACS
jgi:hypothetical protein